jgi:hypothetical protein
MYIGERRPLVVGTSDSVGCSARDRVGPGWVSRFVPYLGSEIKTPEPRSLTAEVAASTHMSGNATNRDLEKCTIWDLCYTPRTKAGRRHSNVRFRRI